MKKILIITLFFGLTTACVNDLDVVPVDPNIETTATLYDDPAVYKQLLAKLYAGMALTGQQGPSGNPDIAGIDEGFSSYLRMYWYHQELTTEEAVIGWNDQTIKDFHHHTWGAGDLFVQALYSRIFYQITFANEFIRETSDGKLSERGISGAGKADVGLYRSEARFLRALSYWHALDLFGKVPFVTDADPIGAFLPEQSTRSELFAYIESELLDMESTMAAPGTNEYARADQAAAWMLLAKLYLNAEVYTGQAKYTECITYLNKVIGGGYSLHSNYQGLFLADNHTSPEVIFPVAFDGANTQTWGGNTFIIHAAVGGNMSPDDFGIDGGWGGTRTTSAFVNKFSDPSGNTDSRAMFFSDGQALEINDIGLFTDGYAITKFKNITSTGTPGAHATFPDTDFPMFRLADAYLMYAEAVVRGGSGGSVADATGYINALRERAYGNTSGNITETDLSLDFILDERARELYWENHRRTDLIRFGKFSQSDYVWPWKGKVKEGISTDSKLDLFPIPSSDLGANPKLTQNPGY
ncbi:MAG: RagB/SusD family nutrient uptake outer membrane protein [Cyclobacteriaceae bacterium]|nr:RagB/SusD family nutrient uptake outer membrane protein [Cyclobacteriaceae bacterium]